MKQLIILLFFISILFNFCWATQSLELSSWDLEAINASRINYIQDSKNTVKKELYLSLIKEKNQHHSLSFLEKHTLKALLPKQIIENLAGEPVFDSTNHAVFITSKEGWVTKYNLHTGQAEINIRVGLKSANSVLSSNGHFLLVGNQQPANLVFLNPKDLSIVQIIPVQDRKGNLSPVTVVRDAGEVHGFIVIPKHFP
ncbi:MAG: hypothetical protein KAI02_05985, partial [Gammaproteobacteria bacterium]|nr:hypothetical protein [Gammaproteobacteria bacterium]